MTDLERIFRQLARASLPEDVFGQLSGSTPSEMRCHGLKIFHSLAKATHPDGFPPAGRAEAEAVFQKVTALWREAEQRIKSGLYGTGKPSAAPITITTRRWSFEIESSFAAGDIANLYRAKATRIGLPAVPAILKIARGSSDNDLIRNEAIVLRELRAGKGDVERHFSHYLPELLTTFRVDDGTGGGGRAANALKFADGYVPLETIVSHHSVGLPLRHVGWMWNRILEALAFVHSKRVVHGAIAPAHLLYHPVDHGLLLIGWSAAILDAPAAQEHIQIISKTYKDCYPPEVFAKSVPTPALDLYMAARAMLYALNGGRLEESFPSSLPKSLAGFLKASLIKHPAHRMRDALGARKDLEDILASLYGSPSYQRLVVPQ